MLDIVENFVYALNVFYDLDDVFFLELDNLVNVFLVQSFEFLILG